MSLKKILIVDDEPDVRAMFEKFLTRKGFEVKTAPNALEALRVCKRDKPDLILTDYHMPEMTGLDLLRELHTAQPGIPVILMSGQADMRTATEALREHAFDFLSKPIDSKELLETITLALRRTETERASEEPPKDEGRLVGPLYIRTLANHPGVVVVSPIRALDEHSQTAYENTFRRLEDESLLTQKVVLVLKNVNYINNVGLNMLITTFDRWKTQGRNVVLAQLSDPVLKYLKVLGYMGYFPVTHGLEEAVQTFPS